MTKPCPGEDPQGGALGTGEQAVEASREEPYSLTAYHHLVKGER